MPQPKRNDRKAKVNGISSKDTIEKYEGFLESEFKATNVEDKGQYVLLHKRVKLLDKKSVDIIVYSTDTIFVPGSATIEKAEFGRIATRIIQLAQQATTPLEIKRPISVLRVKCLLDFVEKLDLDEEYKRMIAIILSDTCNEIILREQMIALKITGAPLDEGIPGKIRRIKEKGQVVIHEDGIMNLRETRNRVVHFGDIPHVDQASEAIKIAKRVLKSVSTE